MGNAFMNISQNYQREVSMTLAHTPPPGAEVVFVRSSGHTYPATVSGNVATALLPDGDFWLGIFEHEDAGADGQGEVGLFAMAGDTLVMDGPDPDRDDLYFRNLTTDEYQHAAWDAGEGAYTAVAGSDGDWELYTGGYICTCDPQPVGDDPHDMSCPIAQIPQ